MVFPEDRLMAKMFNEEMAKFYEKYYENKGVTLIKGDTVTGFEGDGKVQSMSASVYSNDSLALRVQNTPVQLELLLVGTSRLIVDAHILC